MDNPICNYDDLFDSGDEKPDYLEEHPADPVSVDIGSNDDTNFDGESPLPFDDNVIKGVCRDCVEEVDTKVPVTIKMQPVHGVAKEEFIYDSPPKLHRQLSHCPPHLMM